MSTPPLHSVSVAGVIFDDAGRILIIKRHDNGEWQAPGGVLELGETPEEGVVREVFEETGVGVAVERLTGVYKNMAKGVVSLVYRCRALSGVAGTTDEAVAVEWHQLNEATQRMTPAFAVRVEDAARAAGAGAASRTHDGFNLT